MSQYPPNAIGGALFDAPLDPDTGATGLPYWWDYSDALHDDVTLSSATATVAAELEQVGNVTVGTLAEGTTAPDTYAYTSGGSAKVVQVVLKAASAARNGRRYDVTVVATDSNGYEHHRTGRILVADR